MPPFFAAVSAAVIALTIALPIHAAVPKRIVAPYVDITLSDNFDPVQCLSATGQKFFTLAFLVADAQGNPSWAGTIPLSQNQWGDQIAALRAKGGDVIFSFGGENGQEPAIVVKDPEKLAAGYQSVIDAYKAGWFDFDIEGAATANHEANHRRNTALKMLQKHHLIVTYTLPANPDGLSADCLSLLQDAHDQGVTVRSVNLMTMDFGDYYAKDKKISDVCIASAVKCHEQIAAIDPKIGIGIVPMIGQNDMPGEVLTKQDATALVEWATAHPWVTFLSYWSENRDKPPESGKAGPAGPTDSGLPTQAWDYTKIFKPFTH